MKRIAILGGSFDPVHNGHLAIAQAALAAGMDQVVWMPAVASPWKGVAAAAPLVDRWAMLILATLAEPRFLVSHCELDRPAPSYSIETVQCLMAACSSAPLSIDREATHCAPPAPQPPDSQERDQEDLREFWWVVGADHLASLPRWHRIDEMVRLCRFFVVPRSGWEGTLLAQELARLPEWLRIAAEVLPMPLAEVSSTDIRRRIGTGLAFSDLVPAGVAGYLQRYSLYRSVPGALHQEAPVSSTQRIDRNRPSFLPEWSGGPAGSGRQGPAGGRTDQGARKVSREGKPSEQEITAYLENVLPRSRLNHSRMVAEASERLAGIHGADPFQARLAGLAHDLARHWEPQRLLAACLERGLPVQPFDLCFPLPRLHGLLAASLTKELFGIEDPDVLAAISSHTIGRPGMSLLEKVVFVADFIEPGRGSLADPVREIAPCDLDKALRLAMDASLAYLTGHGKAIHPQAVQARNFAWFGIN